MNPFRFALFATPNVCLLALVACSHHQPQTTVEVLDTSLSITSRAKRSALDAVSNQIRHMRRGDRLVLIPVTSDAANGRRRPGFASLRSRRARDVRC